MESVVRFTVLATAAFYDALSGKVVSPAALTFYCDGKQVKPVIKEDRFAVFVNINSVDTAIKVTGAYYCEELIETNQSAGKPDGVIYISLYPCRAYPYKQGCVTLEGSDEKLVSLSMIAVKKSLWLRFGDYNQDDSTLRAESLLGNRIPTEIGLYQADKQSFCTAELGPKQADGRCTIKGNFKWAELVRGLPVKLYKAEVLPSGEFFLLADKVEGDYIAAIQYAKRTVWKTYVENGDKLVLKGGG